MRNTRGINRGQQKSQFDYRLGRSMRTILRKTQCRTLAGQTADNRNRNFTTVSSDPCARSYVKHNAEHSRDKPRTTEIAISLQFRAIDAHNPTEGLSQDTRNRNFTTVSGDRCARSYVKHNAEHSRNKPRTTEIAILLQFRAIHAHDPT